MSIFVNLIGIVLGWSVGGPIGALIGLIIANKLDPRKASVQNKTDIFYISFAGLLALLTKADGIIDGREKDVVRKYIAQYFPTHRQSILSIYEKALNENYDEDRLLQNVTPFFDANNRLAFIDLMFKISFADNKLDDRELSLIKKTARYFGISDYEVESIKVQNMNTEKAGSRRSAGNFSSSSISKSDAYKILGIPAGSSRDEIRTAYHNLIKQYHPDKFEHLGTEFKDIAGKKTELLNAAYHILTN